MLRLPPLTEEQLARKANEQDPHSTHPLRHCLHLYKELNEDLKDFESARQAKVQQTQERSREISGTKLPKVSPRKVSPRSFSSTPRTAHPALVISKGTADAEAEQKVVQENVVADQPEDAKRENHSGVGNWLDCRAFVANEFNFLGIGRQTKKRRGKKYDMASVSVGERGFLRRCKKTLVTRYGTLQAAFKRLDMNHSSYLSMTEFISNTSQIFKPHEARVLYMYLDQNQDQSVSLPELCALLEVS